jgi:hypothetical protein
MAYLLHHARSTDAVDPVADASRTSEPIRKPGAFRLVSHQLHGYIRCAPRCIKTIITGLWFSASMGTQKREYDQT